MTQWEYTEYSDGRIFTSTLADLGLKGWELVTIISRPGLLERAVFKRPLEAPHNAPKARTRKGAK